MASATATAPYQNKNIACILEPTPQSDGDLKQILAKGVNYDFKGYGPFLGEMTLLIKGEI